MSNERKPSCCAEWEGHLQREAEKKSKPCKKCQALILPCEECGGLNTRVQTGLENCEVFDLGLDQESIKLSIFNKAAAKGVRVKHFLLKHRGIGKMALADISEYIGITPSELNCIPIFNEPKPEQDPTMEVLFEILSVLKSIDDRLK